MTRSRDDTLALLAGRHIGRTPVFSGLPSLTAEGLRAAGVRYVEAHTDPTRIAWAAASTFEVYGFESAVVPFDLCVEAEALGCQVDFQAETAGFLAPTISRVLDPEATPTLPDRLDSAGRLPVVAEALRQLKTRIGREVVVGACLPGPFTLAWQLYGAEGWLGQLSDRIEAEARLDALAGWLVGVGVLYRQAGADLLTVHEMGGSPQVVGPALFRRLVVPAVRRLLASLPAPCVLSVCGDTNAVVADLAACGAGALSVDQCNDVRRTRALLGPNAVLLGNLDPVGTLSLGTSDEVAIAVRAAAPAVDAIWPGCDLWPEIPDVNFRTLMETALTCV